MIAIKTRGTKEGWVRGSGAEDIQRLTAEKTNALFAELGMADADFVKAVIDGIQHADSWLTKLRYINEANKMRGGLAPAELRHDAAGQPNVQNDEKADDAYKKRVAALGNGDG